MHARLLIAQVSAEKLEEFIQLWRNEIIPTYIEQQGWNSVRLLIDRQTGKVILMSLWDAQAEVQVSGTQGQKVHAIIRHLLTGRPVVEYYEVAGEA